MRRSLSGAFSAVAIATGLVATTGAQRPAAPRGSGVITGTVRDEAGHPIVDASVAVMRRFRRWGGASYGVSMYPFRDDTDDRGRFRIHSLPPGSYLVVVDDSPAGHVTPAPPEGTSYLRSYFPGTLSLDDAQAIPVSEGEERFIELRLRAVPVTTVSGIAMRSDGSLANRYMVSLHSASPGIGVNPSPLGPVAPVASSAVQPDGTFNVSRVPRGTYTLEVTNRHLLRAGERPDAAQIAVQVKKEPVRGLKVVTLPAATLRGRVVWDGPAPTGSARGTLQAMPVESGFVTRAEVGADGTFEFKGLYGPTRLEAVGAIHWAIKSIDVPNAIREGAHLNLRPGMTVADAKVAATTRVGRLLATVRDSDGTPLVRVVLLPRSPTAAVSYDIASTGHGYRTATRNPEGDYVFENVVPGEYLVAAIDVNPYLLYADADLMEHARAVATAVRIPDSEVRQSLGITHLQPFVHVEITDVGPVVH